MPTIETTINDSIARHLRISRKSWRHPEVIKCENTGRIQGSNERPDIIINEPNTAPIVIETEVLPATTVEIEAKSRLGKRLVTGREIQASVAVRMPTFLRTLAGTDLDQAVKQAESFEYVLFSGAAPDQAERWPSSGWLRGSLDEISLLAQGASIPPHVLENAVDDLEQGIRAAAGRLSELTTTHPGALDGIARHLCQQEGEQTRRMGAAILANAFVFHGSLAGGPGDLANVRTIQQMIGAGHLDQLHVLAEWRAILEVNYWPIFDIARRILETLPAAAAAAIIHHLTQTAASLQSLGLTRSHDLTGAVFQRLIADRGFLAAYYTTPASAALMVGLAFSGAVLRDDFTWDNPQAVMSLRVADFACGTGTLLSTAYTRLGQLHELAGGDAEAIHPNMMADVITGCDVLPAAAHLTASMLAGAHPTITFQNSRMASTRSDRLICSTSRDSSRFWQSPPDPQEDREQPEQILGLTYRTEPTT